MTPLERMRNTFAGRPVDRLAVQPIVMTFAARFAGIPYRDYVTDYRQLVSAQLRVAEAFGIDLASLCSDPCREAADCGATIRWFADQPPAHAASEALLRDKRTLATLKLPDPLGGGRMHDRVKGVALFRERVGGFLPILGWVEGPVAQAADLRGIDAVMLDLVDDPAFATDLFEFVTALELAFAKAQVEAGADIIGVGDAASSLVSPGLYTEYVLPYQQRLIAGIHALGCPVRLHICGNIDHLLPGIATLGVEMIDVDYPSDLAKVRPALGPEVTILGNLEPVRYLLNGTPAQIHTELTRCHALAGERFIVGAGCEVPPHTPPENLHALAAYAAAAAG
ncbi:MAG: uroporphyrinogen decarboxylase [Armatimonadetes bacterium]|jgi:MtaA/CmuA family methyltransferase|nr:uroporphyrinogen decarboxylase [Armatimonadota bacterium]